MKKILCLGLVASICLLTGCTKNYKTVSEYETAMQTVKKQHQNLTIEAKQSVGAIDLYYKTQTKGNKWKTQISMNNGGSYMSTILFDGNDLLTYSQGSPYAVTNPVLDMMSDDDQETKEAAIRMQNPTSPLLNWQNGFGLLSMGTLSGNTEFVNNKDKKNGFDCRLIKIGEQEEACVSDKYGFAVYHKINSEKGDVIIDLVKVETTDIPESEFELPQGVSKMNIDQMLENLTRQIESIKKYY